MIGKLGKQELIDLVAPLAKDVLLKLATKAASSISDKFEKNDWALGRKSRKRIRFINFE